MEKSLAVNRLQNQFRGIVASLRSSGFQEIKSSEVLSKKYWTSLKELFLDARLKLRPDQYEAFVSWVNTQETTVLGDVQNAVKGYEQLAGVANSKPANLALEIRWASALLRRHIMQLAEFRSLSGHISSHVIRSEFSKAIDKIDVLESAVGVSFWSLQLRISLTNEAYGLEAQKQVVSDARAAFDRGLLGFVAYHCGVRNESRTTAERFSVTTESRISKHRFFSEEVKTYLRHILIGDFPATHSGMADILRVSQSHHFIDLYEDLVYVIQALCFSTLNDELYLAIMDFLRIFAPVGDFRLRKISFALEKDDQILTQPLAANEVLISILANEPMKALRTFVHKTTSLQEPNPWDYIYIGWAASEGRLKEPRERRIARRCVRFVAATFMSTELFDPHDAIVKLSRNFGQLPFFRSLWHYSKIINGTSFPKGFEHRIIGLNSAHFGYEDLSQLRLLNLIENESAKTRSEATPVDFWCAFAGHNTENTDDLGAVEVSRVVGKSLRKERLFEEECENFNVHRETNTAKRFFYDLVLLRNAVEYYKVDAVLKIFATSCSSSRYSPLRFKIISSTMNYEWDQFKLCEDPILRSVVINMIWEQNGDAKTRTILRFSIKDFFRSQDAHVPSALNWKQLDVPRSALIYFFDRVCSLDVLDIIRDLRGSRQVLAERANICRVLQEIDPANKHSYSDELAEIQEQISFSDGQLIVDSSRIYVETPQLRQWAKTNLSEDYSRYRDLAKLDIENTQPFDELLADIRTGKRDSSAPFTADREADVLLYDILVRLRDEFLTNSAFGLDFFLSKRIRHQSFIGSIRAPLELGELITNRSDEESGYKPNYAWVNRLSPSNSELRTPLLNAFEEFSEEFDSELISAKDRYFQVQGKEKPTGLIFLPLTSNIIELTKSLSPIDYSFERFLDTAIALMWIGLEPALAITRSFIQNELKDILISSINKLRSNVRRNLGNSSEFLEFDAIIGRCSSEVQVKLDECAGWFARTNLDFTEKTFGLDEAVGMAQKFALSCLPGFEPEIEPPKVESDTRILAPSLVHLHDQILIALQNAKDHSGLKSPKIITFAHADASEGVLSIRVESEVKSSLLRKAREGADERKKMISEGKAAFQTRKEGGSGFFKLAAVASQTSKGKLDFGVTEEGMFFLEVQYSLILEAVQ